MNKLLSISLLFLFSIATSAQTDMHFSDKVIPNSYNEIMDGVLDHDGFIWVTNLKGIMRYNGSEFKLFTSNPLDTNSLTYGRPLILKKGKNKDLWLGTNSGGICRLDLTTYSFKNFRIKNGIDNQSLGGLSVGGILDEGNGIVWVGTDDYCLNKVNWETGIIEKFHPIVDQKNREYSNMLGEIVQDKIDSNVLWVAAPNGVYLFNKSNQSFKLYEFLSYTNIYKPLPIPIFADEDGVIWSSYDDGIARIDPKLDSITILNLMHKKRDIRFGWYAAEIQAFSDSLLVITTHTDGVIFLNKHTFSHHLLNNDLDFVRGANFFLKDQYGNTWINSRAMLMQSIPNDKQFNSISFLNIPGLNWSRAFLPLRNSNSFYIGTLSGHGLLLVNTETSEIESYPYQFDSIRNSDVYMRDLAWTKDSSVLIATYKGLLKFKPEEKVYNRFTSNNKRYKWQYVNSVSSYDSQIWFNDMDEGLFKIKENRGQTEILNSINSLPEVTDIACLDSNTVWVGTVAGAYRISIMNSEISIQNCISDIHVSEIIFVNDTAWVATKGQGLFSIVSGKKEYAQYSNNPSNTLNHIYHLTTSSGSKLWLNTDGGTVSFDRVEKSFTNYIESGEGRRAPIIELSNGLILSGSFRAINYFDPKQYVNRGTPPKPYLTNINIGNREEAFQLAPNEIQHITLRPKERELLLEFDAINFNPITISKFEYRMPGVQDNWFNIKDQKFLNFHQLESGEYTFELRAINVYGGIGDTKKLIIDVRPKLFEIIWFQLFTIITLGIGVLLLFRFLKMKEREKAYVGAIDYFTNARYASNSVDEIVWDLARNIVSRLNFEDCVIYLHEVNSNHFIQKAACGIKNPNGKEIVNPLAIKMGTGIVGNVGYFKESIIVNNTSIDSRYIKDIAQGGSELAVPILHNGVIIGVIDSEHTKKNFYKRELADVIEKIAKETANKLVAAQAIEEIQQKEHDLLNVEKEVAELKLTALQAQMNPHFIFNSLNSINWYILKNKPREASIYLTKFSKLVRTILDNSKNLSIPMDRELEALRLYIELEAMRFENTFDYEIQTDESIDMEEVFIPPLILQPFVENAIWHGLMHKEEKGHLLIQIYPENGHLKCIVQDDGVGRRASKAININGNPNFNGKKKHESKGLKLTTDRIQLLHKDFLEQNTIRIIDLVNAQGEAVGTRVEVLLPYE